MERGVHPKDPWQLLQLDPLVVGHRKRQIRRRVAPSTISPSRSSQTPLPKEHQPRTIPAMDLTPTLALTGMSFAA